MKANIINKNMWKYVDWFLIVIIVVLVGYSLLSIINVTASPFTGDESGFAEFFANLNLNSAMWQLIFFGIGIGAMFFVLLLDYHDVKHFINLIYWICIALLVAVRFLGSEQRGTTGWFMIGNRGFQPGEVAKIAIILVLAKVMSDKTEGNDNGIATMKDAWPAIWRFLIPVALIMSQPDFGTAMVYVFIFAVMLFMARASWKVILILVGCVAIALPILWFSLADWQRLRIFSFLDPSYATTDAGMQVNQAKMAVGSGQMFGKGLFAPGSLSQLDYVPEKHNDFIFAVTTEAFGFMGALVLIVLYFLLIGRTFMLSLRAKDDFGAYIIIGVAAMTLFHVVENIGMNIGMLPVTGIPLPFFSYGGSNMLTNCIAFGMVLSVDMRRQRWQVHHR
ncbi:MAG: rod shape-determining protein RodA [Christensenellaceae bacterium]